MQKSIDDYGANKFEGSLVILHEKLKWPSEEATLSRALSRFIQDIKPAMSKKHLK